MQGTIYRLIFLYSPCLIELDQILLQLRYDLSRPVRYCQVEIK